MVGLLSGLHRYDPAVQSRKDFFMKLRALASAFGLGAVLTLAACGGSSTPSVVDSDPVAVDGAAVSGSLTDFNKADVAFAQGMIPHHEQAVDMADMALDPTAKAGAAVQGLATRIKGAQDAEISLMKGWLAEWKQPVEMDMSDGHDMSTMAGMMSVEEMDALGKSTGAAFDKSWMEMMIVHHEGAISQAQTAKAKGSNPAVAALSEQIISAQQAEIAEMRAALVG
jgi:uncharacterized protein (DUF305 family)